MLKDLDCCLTARHYETKEMVYFLESVRAFKETKRPELRDRNGNFIQQRVREAIESPDFVYEDYRIPSSRRCHYKLEYTVNGKSWYVKIILKYILFTRKDDVLQKVVLRPHQMRAVRKITGRAAHKTKHRALIWHTQGSGKTYTMIVAAERILENPVFNNPTVILLVDRNELETQMFNNLIAAGYDQRELEERTAQTKKHLMELLRNDTRGLIISMIHKF